MKAEIVDKKDAILAAALELISEQGFHGTPMSQIAKKADVSIGIIYHYFSGKEDLINALYLDIKLRLSEYSLRNYSPDMPVRKAFKHLLKSFILYFVERPAELSFIEQCENSPLLSEATFQKCRHFKNTIQDIYNNALEQDLIKDLQFEILGKLLNSSIIALAKLYLAGNIKMEDTIDASLDALWDMVKS
jgi:AcrR family transcriptional regulator